MLILVKSLHYLQEINLANSSITDETVQHIVTHLPRKTIQYASYYITESILTHVVELKKLDLERCKITNAALRYIAQAPSLQHLEFLSFNRCLKIEDSGIITFEASTYYRKNHVGQLLN
jgi:hypothetical protein